MFGDFDRTATLQALTKTFGALPVREPLPASVAARLPGTAPAGETKVLTHRGDASQAAAVVEWPSGGRSLYFRDPDGNSLEFITRGSWGF